jgi:transglutaminase-like putative cysteine protease
VYLQRLLQMNLATLAALGALLLGMGQRNPWLPLLVSAAAMSSIWLTDVAGWLRLKRMPANVIVIAVVLYWMGDLWQSAGEARILGIANLVVCLQLILLFQEKDERVYRHLIMLSLLQVVVATLLSQGIWFGLLLVAYMMVGFSALSLLSLHRQWSRCGPAGQPPAPAAALLRWPLAAERTSFAGTAADQGQGAIGWELLGRLGRMGLGTLLVTCLLFLSVPRLGRTAWRGALPATKHLVGFSDSVALGELGEIIESPEEVMRVWLVDYATGEPYPARGEIYLYGAPLMKYFDGQWRPGTPARDAVPKRLEKTRALPAAGLVRQKCVVEPLDCDELFYVMPLVVTRSNPNIYLDGNRQRLLRADGPGRGRFSYELGTTALVGGVQQPLVPGELAPPTEEALQMPPGDDPRGLPSLAALAERWIAQSRLPPEERLGRARYLERMLAASGRFQYSLEGQARDPAIDPIEDFVTNNPRGHCEYFATALTMMLRSQEIPARMIVGYKCDEFNELGDFYQVRQLHAHTWVEAWLPGEELKALPPAWLHGKGYWDWSSEGGWLRLDPTPAIGQTKATAAGSFIARVKQTVDWLQSVWADYVMEMDRGRQRQAIYQPVLRAARQVIRCLSDPDWWRGLLQRIRQTIDGALRHGMAGAWVRLGLMLLAGLLLPAIVLRWVWRPAWRLCGRLAARAGPAAARDRSQVEFYGRLEALLAQHGLARGAGQTQREFAIRAGVKIAEAAGRPQLSPLPGRVVEAYYQVRFGRLPLDNPQAEAVEHALAELSAASDQQSAISNPRMTDR